MRDMKTIDSSDLASWPLPGKATSAGVGAALVLAFTVVHGVFISDIWFNAVPMIVAGALSGLTIAWSYGSGVRRHSTGAWFGYAALLSAEMVVLGIASLVVLEPRFTMAELLLRDDAFDLLIPPSVPLMVATMVFGTLAFWLVSNRRRAALVPILTTQVLLVFLLGHQFAFLGLVEQSSQLLVALLEFSVITLGLAGAFSASVMWTTIATSRATGR